MPGGALAAGGAIGGAIIGGSAAKKAAKTQANAANTAAANQMRQYYQTRSDMAPWRNVGAGALGMLGDLYNVPYGYHGQSDMTPSVTGGFGSGTVAMPGVYGAQTALTPAQISQIQTDRPDIMQAAQASGGDVNGFINNWYNQTRQSVGDQYQLPRSATSPTDPSGGADSANRFGAFFTSPDYQFRLGESLNALNTNRATAGLLNSGGTLKAITKYAGDLASGEFNNYTNRLAALAGVGQTATNNTAALGADAVGASNNALMAGANAQARGTANQAAGWTNAFGQIGNAAANYFAPYNGGYASGVSGLGSYDFGTSGIGSNPFANIPTNQFSGISF